MAIRAPTNLENFSSMRRPLTVAILCRASVDTSFLLEKAVLRGGLDKALRRSLSTAWSRSFEDLTNQSHICCAKSKESHILSKLFNRSSPPIIYGQTEILPQYGGQYPQNDSSGYFGLTITTRQTTSGVESGRACGKCTEPDICNSASDWAADHCNTVYWEGGRLESWHRQLLYVPLSPIPASHLLFRISDAPPEHGSHASYCCSAHNHEKLALHIRTGCCWGWLAVGTCYGTQASSRSNNSSI